MGYSRTWECVIAEKVTLFWYMSCIQMSTRQHGASFQKIDIFIVIAVGTSNSTRNCSSSQEISCL
jgi:hypothetical protein